MRSFPFGIRPICRGENLLVSGRVIVKTCSNSEVVGAINPSKDSWINFLGNFIKTSVDPGMQGENGGLLRECLCEKAKGSDLIFPVD